MYLFRGGDDASEEHEALRIAKWDVWIKGLGSAFIDGAPLDTVGKVLRSSVGPPEDDVFGEGEQEVGGFVLVEADSLEQAVAWARGCPAYETNGVVEIREAVDM